MGILKGTPPVTKVKQYIGSPRNNVNVCFSIISIFQKTGTKRRWIKKKKCYLVPTKVVEYVSMK